MIFATPVAATLATLAATSPVAAQSAAAIQVEGNRPSKSKPSDPISNPVRGAV